MTVLEILGASWATLGAAELATIAIYAAIILATRVMGLRSFAKMSSFDFAATVATGSILATVALTSASLGVGLVSVVVLYLAQWAVAVARASGRVQSVVDNSPVLLMEGPRMLEDNMRRARVTKDDLVAKLREANVTRLEQVRYVVLESTGDVSVLHADPGAPPVEEDLLYGVDRSF